MVRRNRIHSQSLAGIGTSGSCSPRNKLSLHRSPGIIRKLVQYQTCVQIVYGGESWFHGAHAEFDWARADWEASQRDRRCPQHCQHCSMVIPARIRLQNNKWWISWWKLYNVKKYDKVERQKEAMEAARIAKLSPGARPPQDMFRNDSSHLAWDDDGMPTRLADGTPMSRSAINKRKKMWRAEQLLHEKYLALRKTWAF